MSERLTQEDADLLADILWWIRGYNSGLDDCRERYLGESHLDVLRRCRIAIMEGEQGDTGVSPLA